MPRARRQPAAPHLPVWFVASLFAIFSLLFWFLIFPKAAASSASLTVGTRTISLEIADSQAERLRGLSGRSSLAPDAGMLFVFPTSNIYSFWMNGMQFPLDIIWISRGKVVDVVTLPPPSIGSSEIPQYKPSVDADMVLELNAGQAAMLGLVTGTVLHIER